MCETRCDLCAHWRDRDGGRGDCRRYPVAVVKRSDSRCGEFDERDSAECPCGWEDAMVVLGASEVDDAPDEAEGAELDASVRYGLNETIVPEVVEFFNPAITRAFVEKEADCFVAAEYGVAQDEVAEDEPTDVDAEWGVGTRFGVVATVADAPEEPESDDVG